MCGAHTLGVHKVSAEMGQPVFQLVFNTSFNQLFEFRSINVV